MANYTIVWLPRWWTSIKEKSVLERLEEELLMSGVLLEVKEKTGYSVKADFAVDALAWTCDDSGTNICPAIVFDMDEGKGYVVKINPAREKFVEIIDLAKYVIDHIKGIERYNECVAKYGYDYC